MLLFPPSLYSSSNFTLFLVFYQQNIECKRFIKQVVLSKAKPTTSFCVVVANRAKADYFKWPLIKLKSFIFPASGLCVFVTLAVVKKDEKFKNEILEPAKKFFFKASKLLVYVK